MSFRRTFVAVLGICLLILGSQAGPAYARYGRTPVDTWARFGDRLVDRNGVPGPLAVRVPAGTTRHVIWSIKNLGGAYPRLHRVTFFGCADGNGFRFRYVTPAGSDVTRAVINGGYHVRGVNANEKVWLTVRVTATASGRMRSCTLTGDGNGSPDAVTLRVTD